MPTNDPDTLLDEPEPARNCPHCGSGPLSRNLATDWLTCLACGKRSWPSGRPHVEDEARPDTLLDDLDKAARSLGGPRATRTEDELALTMREAAEEIRTLRALVARREAEATTHWNELDDLKKGPPAQHCLKCGQWETRPVDGMCLECSGKFDYRA